MKSQKNVQKYKINKKKPRNNDFPTAQNFCVYKRTVIKKTNKQTTTKTKL